MSDDFYPLNELKDYLEHNNFKLNSYINIYDNPEKYYYKHPLVVIFLENNDILIKDLLENRNYEFKSGTSDFLLVEFLKFLENCLHYTI